MSERSYHGATSPSLNQKDVLFHYNHTMSKHSYHRATSRSLNQNGVLFHYNHTIFSSYKPFIISTFTTFHTAVCHCCVPTNLARFSYIQKHPWKCMPFLGKWETLFMCPYTFKFGHATLSTAGPFLNCSVGYISSLIT